MAWGSKNTATQVTSIGTTEKYFTSEVTLNPGETAHVQVDANPPSSPSHDLIVNVYGTLDASTENWDDTPMMVFVIDKDSDPNAISFPVTGIYKFRIGMYATGATTWTSADMAWRLDGVSL